MNDTESVIAIVLSAVAVITSLLWVAGDARKRKKGFAVVMLCFFTWPLRILIWLFLRPDISTEDRLA